MTGEPGIFVDEPIKIPPVPADIVFKEPQYIRDIKAVIFSPNRLKEGEYIKIYVRGGEEFTDYEKLSGYNDFSYQQLVYYLREEDPFIEINHIGVFGFGELNLFRIKTMGRQYYLFYNQCEKHIKIIRRDFYSKVEEKEPQNWPDLIKEIIERVQTRLGIPERDHPYPWDARDWGLFMDFGLKRFNINPATLPWQIDTVTIRDISIPFYYKLVERGYTRGAIAFILLCDLIQFYDLLITKYYKETV